VYHHSRFCGKLLLCL